MSVKITGLGEIQRNAAQAVKRVKGATRAGAVALAEQIADNAARRTPQDTRELVESLYVSPSGDDIEIGYGAAHAAAVHERTEVPHTVGEAKFLERAIADERVSGLQTIADNLGPLDATADPRPTRHPERPPGGRGE